MAQTKTKSKTSKKGTKNVISSYMDYVLEKEHFPKNVYKFCKEASLTEAQFYEEFNSLEQLQQEIWVAFHNHTHQLLASQLDETASPKERLLTYYYTLFEMLTANRSYCLFVLDHNTLPKGMSQLSELRKKVRSYATMLIQSGNDQKNLKLLKHPESVFAEAVWVQFLFLLRFWLKDTSKGFEKTDVAIEKSVQTAFDVFETQPLESLVDFGKFLWKEYSN